MNRWGYSVVVGAGACAVWCATLVAQDNVYYRTFKVKPTQSGKLKTKFYYNSVEFPDILSSMVTLSFNEYTYVFNQTNDISDMFYWHRTSKVNGIYKYDRWIDNGGRVKMLLNTRQQWATIDLKGVNLLGLATNRTGVHAVGMQISGFKKTEQLALVNYKHAGHMPYGSNFFLASALSMRYNKGPADMFMLRFIAKYNNPTNLPETVPATFVVDGQGQVSEFSGLTFGVPLQRKTTVTFAGEAGPVRASVNFKTGTGTLVYKKQALPIDFAPSQTNVVFNVRAVFGEPAVFDEQTTFRAAHVHINNISY